MLVVLGMLDVKGYTVSLPKTACGSLRFVPSCKSYWHFESGRLVHKSVCSNSGKLGVTIQLIQESSTSIDEWFIIELHLGWIKYGQYSNIGLGSVLPNIL